MAGSVSVREKEKEMMARGTFSEKVLRIKKIKKTNQPNRQFT